MTHNPDFKILCTRKGTKKDETHLHKLLNKHRINKTEWFSYSKFILKVFNEYSQTKLDQEYSKNIITMKHINKLIKDNDVKRLKRLQELIDKNILVWKDGNYLVWNKYN